jgi:hypothetical protein
MLQAQYFDRHGRQLSREEACDRNGIMRDGIIARTRLVMRDGDPFALHRPGFRSSSSDSLFGDQLARDAKREANEAHRYYLENAWRNPTTRLAAVTDEEDDAVNGDNDKRSIAQRVTDHQTNMDKVYADYAARQSGAWKEGK